MRVSGSEMFSRGRRCLRPPYEVSGRRSELCRAFSFRSDSLVVVATCVGAKPNHGFFHCQHPAATFFRAPVCRLRPARHACDADRVHVDRRHPPAAVCICQKTACFTDSARCRLAWRPVRAWSCATRGARLYAHREVLNRGRRHFCCVPHLWRCTSPNAPKCANFSRAYPGCPAQHLDASQGSTRRISDEFALTRVPVLGVNRLPRAVRHRRPGRAIR